MKTKTDHIPKYKEKNGNRFIVCLPDGSIANIDRRNKYRTWGCAVRANNGRRDNDNHI